MAPPAAPRAAALLLLLCAAAFTSVTAQAPVPAPFRAPAPAPGPYAMDMCVQQCEQDLADSFNAIQILSALDGAPSPDMQNALDSAQYCELTCQAQALAAAPGPSDCVSDCRRSLQISALYADLGAPTGDTSGSQSILSELAPSPDGDVCSLACAYSSGDLFGLAGLGALGGLSASDLAGLSALADAPATSTGDLFGTGTGDNSGLLGGFINAIFGGLGLGGSTTPMPTPSPTTRPISGTTTRATPSPTTATSTDPITGSAQTCALTCVQNPNGAACTKCSDCFSACDSSPNPLTCVQKC